MSIATSSLAVLRKRVVWRPILVASLLFLAAGLLAPWVDASHWSAPIRQRLQVMLGRRVEFESVHFTLFSGPGLTLENVVIADDPRYGIEPFAFVPAMQVRVPLDRLLLGEIRLANLRLLDPSLNFVKRNDGDWNVVDLVRRLGAPRRSPLNLFPVLEVTGARIDFKFETRKTTLYVLDTDLSVYPERSGKLFLQFSGSPARTDRAGNGFGRVRGRINWFLNGSGLLERMQADLNLDPSNLSELATLIEGHDVGVHGNISTHLLAEGKLDRLDIRGAMQFGDLHRWDLLPASGEDWTIRYSGSADLVAHRLALETIANGGGASAQPLSVALRVDDFLTRPAWSIAARLQGVPVENLLPLGRRMGLNLPARLNMTGSVDGTLTLTSSVGLDGSAVISGVTVALPDAAPLHTETLRLRLQQDRLHLEPTPIATHGGELQVSGDCYLMTPRTAASITMQNFSAADLKTTLSPWLMLPASLAFVHDGDLSGQLLFTHDDRPDAAAANSPWSGRLQVTGATLSLPGLALPLREFDARVVLEGDQVDIPRFAGLAGDRPVRGAYRYNPAARRSEHLHLELTTVALNQLQAMLAPTFEAQGWLARLRVGHRNIPTWLAERNMDGDIAVNHFVVNDSTLGPLTSHFVWRSTSLQFPSVVLKLPPAGWLRAQGTVGLDSYVPSYSFTAAVRGYSWRGGSLSADGTFETTGTGLDLLRHLQAAGNFTGSDLTLAPDSVFSSLAGAFKFSFADGWPNLHIAKLQAEDGENSWSGEGTTESDGKLILDLEHAGQLRRVVSALEASGPAALSLFNQ